MPELALDYRAKFQEVNLTVFTRQLVKKAARLFAEDDQIHRAQTDAIIFLLKSQCQSVDFLILCGSSHERNQPSYFSAISI